MSFEVLSRELEFLPETPKNPHTPMLDREAAARNGKTVGPNGTEKPCVTRIRLSAAVEAIARVGAGGGCKKLGSGAELAAGGAT